MLQQAEFLRWSLVPEGHLVLAKHFCASVWRLITWTTKILIVSSGLSPSVVLYMLHLWCSCSSLIEPTGPQSRRFVGWVIVVPSCMAFFPPLFHVQNLILKRSLIFFSFCLVQCPYCLLALRRSVCRSQRLSGRVGFTWISPILWYM